MVLVTLACRVDAAKAGFLTTAYIIIHLPCLYYFLALPIVLDFHVILWTD
jgi:hypothetical protein